MASTPLTSKIALPNRPPAPLWTTNGALRTPTPEQPTVMVRMLHTDLTCMTVAGTTILAVLLANKGMCPPNILGPQFKSIRFFEILLINIGIGFTAFFAVKFKALPMGVDHVHYLSFVVGINTMLLLYFRRYCNTHTAFDEFTQTLMLTYHSEHEHNSTH